MSDWEDLYDLQNKALAEGTDFLVFQFMRVVEVRILHSEGNKKEPEKFLYYALDAVWRPDPQKGGKLISYWIANEGPRELQKYLDRIPPDLPRKWKMGTGSLRGRPGAIDKNTRRRWPPINLHTWIAENQAEEYQENPK
jgi:hypothetical protein